MPHLALQYLCDVVYKEGAEKYGRDNWRKGLKYSDTVDHMMNHFYNFMNRNAEDSSLEIAKVAWGALTLLEFELNGRSRILNDMTYDESKINLKLVSEYRKYESTFLKDALKEIGDKIMNDAKKGNITND